MKNGNISFDTYDLKKNPTQQLEYIEPFKQLQNLLNQEEIDYIKDSIAIQKNRRKLLVELSNLPISTTSDLRNQYDILNQKMKEINKKLSDSKLQETERQEARKERKFLLDAMSDIAIGREKIITIAEGELKTYREKIIPNFHEIASEMRHYNNRPRPDFEKFFPRPNWYLFLMALALVGGFSGEFAIMNQYSASIIGIETSLVTAFMQAWSALKIGNFQEFGDGFLHVLLVLPFGLFPILLSFFVKDIFKHRPSWFGKMITLVTITTSLYFISIGLGVAIGSGLTIIQNIISALAILGLLPTLIIVGGWLLYQFSSEMNRSKAFRESKK